MSEFLTSVTLILNRTPPPELTPNRSRGKSKWSTDEHVATMRAAAAAAATDYLNRNTAAAPLFRGDVAVDVVIYWERTPRYKNLTSGEVRIEQAFRSKIDFDGAIGALKSSFDGLQGSIIANDRQIKQIAVDQIHDIDRAGTMTMTVRDIGTAPLPCPVCDGPRVHAWAGGVHLGLYCAADDWLDRPPGTPHAMRRTRKGI